MTLCWMTLENAVSRWREKLDAGVHGPRLGDIFFGGIFVPLWPSRHPTASCPVSVRGGPGLSSHADPFSFLLRRVLRGGGFWSRASRAIRLRHWNLGRAPPGKEFQRKQTSDPGSCGKRLVLTEAASGTLAEA